MRGRAVFVTAPLPPEGFGHSLASPDGLERYRRVAAHYAMLTCTYAAKINKLRGESAP
jgi:hypothetical protein